MDWNPPGAKSAGESLGLRGGKSRMEMIPRSEGCVREEVRGQIAEAIEHERGGTLIEVGESAKRSLPRQSYRLGVGAITSTEPIEPFVSSSLPNLRVTSSSVFATPSTVATGVLL